MSLEFARADPDRRCVHRSALRGNPGGGLPARPPTRGPTTRRCSKAEMHLPDTVFTHPMSDGSEADWALRWFTLRSRRTSAARDARDRPRHAPRPRRTGHRPLRAAASSSPTPHTTRRSQWTSPPTVDRDRRAQQPREGVLRHPRGDALDDEVKRAIAAARILFTYRVRNHFASTGQDSPSPSRPL